MQPVDYVKVVVLPTVREHFLAATDERLGVLACIATFHICDHVALAKGHTNASLVCHRMRERCQAEFDILQGICHGTKHGITKSHLAHQHRAGDAIVSPAFAFDDPDAGWGKGAWGGPALAVEHGGRRYTFGECLTEVLRAFGDLYPQYFPSDVLGPDALMAVVLPNR